MFKSWMYRWILWFLTGALCLGLGLGTAWGQEPDCKVFFHFTAVNQTSPTAPNAGLDNRTLGCTVWTMNVSTSGFSSVTVAAQSAPDSSGVAGTWVTFAGQDIISPSPHNNNPITTATQDFVWLVGYNPWVRVKVTAVTGSGVIDGALYGFRNPGSSSSSVAATDVTIVGPLGQALMAASIPVVVSSNQSSIPVTTTPSGTQDVNLKQVGATTVLTGGVAGSQGIGGLSAEGAAPTGNPVPVGQRNSAGVIIPEYCTSRAAFTNPSTGSTQLVAVSSTTTIRVCEFFFSGDTLTTVQLVTGTGSSCTSPTAETGVISGAGGGVFGVAMDFPSGALVTTAAKTLCLSLSAGSTGGGYITYSQR